MGENEKWKTKMAVEDRFSKEREERTKQKRNENRRMYIEKRGGTWKMGEKEQNIVGGKRIKVKNKTRTHLGIWKVMEEIEQVEKNIKRGIICSKGRWYKENVRQRGWQMTIGSVALTLPLVCGGMRLAGRV